MLRVACFFGVMYHGGFWFCLGRPKNVYLPQSFSKKTASIFLFKNTNVQALILDPVFLSLSLLRVYLLVFFDDVYV